MQNDRKHISDIALWRGVIIQSAMDCLSQSKKREEIKARNDALEWLSIDNQNFLMVCHFAQLEPTYVIKKIKHGLKQQQYWRRSCDIGKGLQFLPF